MNPSTRGLGPGEWRFYGVPVFTDQGREEFDSPAFAPVSVLVWTGYRWDIQKTGVAAILCGQQPQTRILLDPGVSKGLERDHGIVLGLDQQGWYPDILK